MKILLLHNRYVYPGGEDTVVNAERKLLESHGHEVVLYAKDNNEINQFGLLRKTFFILKDVFWSEQSYREVKGLIKNHQFDLAHVHNTFYQMSPSVYQACHDAGIPIVQTLHNYRFLCPAGTFYRKGKVCTDCLRQGRWAAVINRCWRNSFIASFTQAGVVDQFYRKGIFAQVDVFIALSQFSKGQFLSAGFPSKKIYVKSNFLDVDPGVGVHKEPYALFVGLLQDYKGIKILVDAWKDIPYPLRIIGDGPLREDVLNSIHGGNIEFLGKQPFSTVMEQIKHASFVVLPSQCYENFPRVIVEAYACGTPVLASRLGAMAELVIDGETGLHFTPWDSSDLKAKALRLIGDKALLAHLAQQARQEFRTQYTAERNYQSLMDIYSVALSCRNKELI